MPYEYDYPRPALTVDCAVFAPRDGNLDILLIQRGEPPFEGEWATPGGFVDIDEPVAEAAPRELAEETGMTEVELAQFGLFDAPGRDPRGRIVAAAHWGLTRREDHQLEAATDAREVGWFAIDDLPELAFDHDELVPAALRALRSRARTGPIGRGVVDEPFELDELFGLYEAVLAHPLDEKIFRRALKQAGFLDAAGGGRFRFDRREYDRVIREPMTPFRKRYHD